MARPFLIGNRQRRRSPLIVGGREVDHRLGEAPLGLLERLADALFDRDEYIVTGLWPPAADRDVSPTPTLSVRRLLLRPSDQTWWDGDIYAEAEAIYGVEELETVTDA